MPSMIEFQSLLIVWIFAMRILMVFTSIFSYKINQIVAKARYENVDRFNFEGPLTALVWVTSIVSIVVTYIISYLLLSNNSLVGIEELYTEDLWWKLATIISLGTFAAAIIPEFTKIFTSSQSAHVNEVVISSREGGPSLNILSGMVAGNFSAFWIGMLMVALMVFGFFVSLNGLELFGEYSSIFAFGLVAFGFLGMGPVTIAVDSYGPVTDNAQSVFELSQMEKIPGIKEEIERDYGFTPDFERGKHFLEANDGAGNTFKATAKPVLIGTAVVGATTMIFAIILMLKTQGLLKLSLTDAPVLLGFITGGSVIFWFSGASMQAVTAGAYRAVEFIKKNINLNKTEADIEDSKKVVKICTQYALKGMWNIFIVIFTLTLAFAFFDPNFFVSYLISIAIFGLFQALYMANAGGAWDNAKKVVEVDLKEKNTPLHEACVVGDTVGDPYKDTTAVSINPIIKFSTLFGLLAVEIAVLMKQEAKATDSFDFTPIIGILFLAVGLVFAYRSFYSMRIKNDQE
jgi:K(+)-stimulated pyrophosphate-energized sodium pump